MATLYETDFHTWSLDQGSKPRRLPEGDGDALRHFGEGRPIAPNMPRHVPETSPFDVEHRLRDEWWRESRGRD